MSRSYVAFISYKHARRDAAIAKEVHTLIENYVIPASLRKGERKLGVVFRDEEELPISSDLSDSIRVTTQNVDLARAGVYSITVQVTNSLGDVESLPLKVVMTDSALGSPQVALSSYIIYREVGQAFNPNNYISVPTSSSAVTIESNVDTSRAGIYEVTYTYQGDTVYQTVVVR